MDQNLYCAAILRRHKVPLNRDESQTDSPSHEWRPDEYPSTRDNEERRSNRDRFRVDLLVFGFPRGAVSD